RFLGVGSRRESVFRKEERVLRRASCLGRGGGSGPLTAADDAGSGLRSGGGVVAEHGAGSLERWRGVRTRRKASSLGHDSFSSLLAHGGGGQRGGGGAGPLLTARGRVRDPFYPSYLPSSSSSSSLSSRPRRRSASAIVAPSDMSTRAWLQGGVVVKKWTRSGGTRKRRL
ncbi:unnamed protein product, partial [Discosporangium mesarthrocarpum]